MNRQNVMWAARLRLRAKLRAKPLARHNSAGVQWTRQKRGRGRRRPRSTPSGAKHGGRWLTPPDHGRGGPNRGLDLDLEKEHSQLEDEEHEASLPDALADRTKVVKLVVDKWFVDKGFGFGKVHIGEVVFNLVSVVRRAEVFCVGPDAWVQVVHHDARVQRRYRACKAKRQEEGEQTALTTELAAKSQKEISEVCSHPLGLLDELVSAAP